MQKYRNGKPDKDPFRLPGEMIFQAGDRIRLDLTSPQSGYFYLINEGPMEINGLPTFNMLFPSPTANNNSSAITANQHVQIPAGSWFKIDDERGTEKLWMIWSAQRVDELEAIAKAVVTPQTLGVISDPSQITTVQKFIAKYSATQPEVTKDEEKKQTNVRGKSEVLMNLVKLEHY